MSTSVPSNQLPFTGSAVNSSTTTKKLKTQQKQQPAQLPCQIETLVRIETALINLSRALRGQGGNLLEICNDYVDTTWEQRSLDNLEKCIVKDDKTKKIVRTCLMLERLSIIVIVHCFLDKKVLQANLSNLRNIVQYCHHNFISVIDLLLSAKVPCINALTSLINNNNGAMNSQQQNGNSNSTTMLVQNNRSNQTIIDLEQLIPF